MKKIWLFFLILVFAATAAGCASFPTKRYIETMPKVDKIFVENAEVYLNKSEIWGRKEFKNRVDNMPYYKEVSEIYTAVLKQKLQEYGFINLQYPEAGCLIIKTKIENQTPGVVGILIGGAVGRVIAEIQISQNREDGEIIPLLTFDNGGNTSKFLTSKIVIKVVARRVAKRVSKEFK